MPFPLRVQANTRTHTQLTFKSRDFVNWRETRRSPPHDHLPARVTSLHDARGPSRTILPATQPGDLCCQLAPGTFSFQEHQTAGSCGRGGAFHCCFCNLIPHYAIMQGYRGLMIVLKDWSNSGELYQGEKFKLFANSCFPHGSEKASGNLIPCWDVLLSTVIPWHPRSIDPRTLEDTKTHRSSSPLY